MGSVCHMGDLSEFSWRLVDTIQKAIEARRMTDAEIIARSGVPRNTFYRKMRGETPLNTDDIDKFAHALGLDPFALVRGDFALAASDDQDWQSRQEAEHE